MNFACSDLAWTSLLLRFLFGMALELGCRPLATRDMSRRNILHQELVGKGREIVI